MPTDPAPATPEPDTKDWTWTVERPCPDCGFDASALRRDDVPLRTRDLARRLVGSLERPDAAARPSPAVWSPLEYVAHVRDVCDVFAGRVEQMVLQDDPLFDDWDQDTTALEQRYWEQDPQTVADETRAAAQRVAAVFAAIGPDAWPRTGRRSNGSAFTVESIGAYFLHDLEHHAWDVGV